MFILFVVCLCWKDNIAPDDCREFQNETQILSITLDRLLECQKIPPTDHLPDDLITYVFFL